jgi:hypothetical protein
MMTAQEFAARLNGREYGKEITRPEAAEAKAAGLVVVYGYSDDNVELAGAITDEVSAYDGTTLRISPLGLIPDWETFAENENEESAYEAYFAKKTAGIQEIEAVWSPGEVPGTSWIFKTAIPHHTFDVMEDGEVFCRGIVFALADVKGAEA